MGIRLWRRLLIAAQPMKSNQDPVGDFRLRVDMSKFIGLVGK